jgi:hypothetical protein
VTTVWAAEKYPFLVKSAAGGETTLELIEIVGR